MKRAASAHRMVFLLAVVLMVGHSVWTSTAHGQEPLSESGNGAWQKLIGTTPSGLVEPPAGDDGFWPRSVEGIQTLWSTGGHDVYLTGHIWHAPWRYSPEQRTRYNVAGWGLGYGRTKSDTRDRLRTLYGIASLDSYSRVQYMGGYGWRAQWKPQQSGLVFGGGYTLMVIGRYETKYLPVVMPLPLVSIGTSRLTVMGAFVPFKDVMFTFASVRF